MTTSARHAPVPALTNLTQKGASVLATFTPRAGSGRIARGGGSPGVTAIVLFTLDCHSVVEIKKIQ